MLYLILLLLFFNLLSSGLVSDSHVEGLVDIDVEDGLQGEDCVGELVLVTGLPDEFQVLAIFFCLMPVN